MHFNDSQQQECQTLSDDIKQVEFFLLWKVGLSHDGPQTRVHAMAAGVVYRSRQRSSLYYSSSRVASFSLYKAR